MSATYVVGDQPVPGAGYRLVAFLGRGGFGEVWKATAPGGAEAALKIIRLGSREGRKELRALQLVKRIHHTHLVPIIAFWIKNEKGEILDDAAVLQADPPEPAPRTTAAAPTVPYDSMLAPAPLDGPAELIIAMGLGEGNLFDRLEKCRQEGLPGIPDDELLGYMDDSAEAIDFLNSPVHDLGSGPVAIQHCDIKPHNLVIVGGSVQVCDFGLARMMGADRATTAAASVAYAAPECLVKGKPAATTDQYCLAVTFVELKTGQLPYSDLTMAAVMDAKRNDKLDFAMLPQPLRPVLRRATASDPAKRYGSCREMVQELRRGLAATESTAARPKSRTARRVAIAALALAILGGAGVWGWQMFLPLRDGSEPIPIKPNTGHPILIASGDSPRASSARPVDSSLTVSQGTKAIKETKSGTEPVTSASAEGDVFLANGTAALKSRDFARAVTDLEKASKLLPRDVHVFSRLGAARLAQKRWDEAIAACTKAIDLEANDVDYYNRGVAYEGLKSVDNAIADYSKAARHNPMNASAFAALGTAYVSKGDPERAVVEFTSAINICQTDSKANYPELNLRVLRGNANIALGKLAESAADLERAGELASGGTPTDVQSIFDAAMDLAAKYAEAGKHTDAVRWGKKAVELAPDTESKTSAQERLSEYQKAAKPAQSGHSPP